ncbi:MAG: family 16 glycosylhydrolase [Solirubrobacterales bacterium]
MQIRLRISHLVISAIVFTTLVALCLVFAATADARRGSAGHSKPLAFSKNHGGHGGDPQSRNASPLTKRLERLCGWPKQDQAWRKRERGRGNEHGNGHGHGHHDPDEPEADTAPPSPPTNLRITGRSETTATVAWDSSTDNDAIAHYEILVDLVSAGTTPDTAFEFQIPCGQIRSVIVLAFDPSGNSGVSGPLAVSGGECTPPDQTPPSQPGNTRAIDITKTSATIVWDPSTDQSGLAEYVLILGGEVIGATSATSFAIAGACGSTVSVIVVAFDTVGNSRVGQPTDVTFAACEDPTGPTGWPTGPTGEPTGPTGEPTGPTGEPTGPTGEPTGPTGEPTGPTDVPTGPTGEPTGPTGEPTGPTGEPTGPTGPVDPPEDPAPLGIAGTWNLDFQDEFNGTTLDSLVWAPWRIEGPYANGPFNPTIEDADYSPANVSVGGGNLALSISQQPAGSAYPFSSGMIQSGPGFSFFRGYVEARIRVDACAGCWPAFWMLDVPTSSSSTTETDIVEFFDTLADPRPYFNFHWASYTSQLGALPYGASGSVYTGAFHTYGLLWTSDGLQVFLDGVPGPTYTDVANLPSVANYLLFNLAVERGDTPAAGSQMLVDYVRVWSGGVG